MSQIIKLSGNLQSARLFTFQWYRCSFFLWFWIYFNVTVLPQELPAKQIKEERENILYFYKPRSDKVITLIGCVNE